MAKTTLSDVAAELGVTRQTVYRHFARISDIVAEVAAQGADAFADRLVAHLSGVTDPAEAVVEGMLFCLRTIPAEPRVSLLFQLGDSTAFGQGATIAYGARMLRRFAVDWEAAGITDADLPGLAEMIMRLLSSLLQHPATPPRDEARVRALLVRWLAPALAVTPSS